MHELHRLTGETCEQIIKNHELQALVSSQCKSNEVQYFFALNFGGSSTHHPRNFEAIFRRSLALVQDCLSS